MRAYVGEGVIMSRQTARWFAEAAKQRCVTLLREFDVDRLNLEDLASASTMHCSTKS